MIHLIQLDTFPGWEDALKTRTKDAKTHTEATPFSTYFLFISTAFSNNSLGHENATSRRDLMTLPHYVMSFQIMGVSDVKKNTQRNASFFINHLGL